jgi:hypothetical protein
MGGALLTSLSIEQPDQLPCPPRIPPPCGSAHGASHPLSRDDNSGMGIRYLLGSRPDGHMHGFFTCGCHPYSTRIKVGTERIFFSTHGNPAHEFCLEVNFVE